MDNKNNHLKMPDLIRVNFSSFKNIFLTFLALRISSVHCNCNEHSKH